MLLDALQSLRAVLTPAVVLGGVAAVLVVLGSVVAGVVFKGRNYAVRRQLRHLRRVGVSPGQSNMRDQYDSRYDLPQGGSARGPIRIKAIYIHPVKSFAPIEVDRALLTKSGFMYDRCFAMAAEVAQPDPDTGARKKFWRFISQRTKPAMSLIQTELWLPHQGSDASHELVRAGGCLVIRFPDPDRPSWTSRAEALLHTWNPAAVPEVSFIAPLSLAASHDSGGTALRPFVIHGRTAQGIDMGRVPSVAAALPKLKRFLKMADSTPLTLFRCTPDALVRTEKNLAPLRYIGSPAVHGYTDQQPVNVASLSSVHDFAALLPTENRPLNALRFRANIWIAGAPAYDEEGWTRCRIVRSRSGGGDGAPGAPGRARVDAVLCVVCRTSRCTMPNVDPDKGVLDTGRPAADGEKGKPQPSTALIQHRTVETGNAAAMGYMGMHCVPEDRSLDEAQEQNLGLYVGVGDEIEVLERGEHVYGLTGEDY